jgi:hypothetical protein
MLQRKSTSRDGIVGSAECLIINFRVRRSQLQEVREMGHRKYMPISAIVLAALAAQAIAAPKRPAPKKPPPKLEAAEPALLPSMSTFITYDVGTLRMTGKTTADATYNIGTLRFIGRTSASTIYSVGTLKLIGAAAVPVSYNVGTLSMTGKLEP